jgi:hypothetical protein
MRPNVFGLLRCTAFVLFCSVFVTSVAYAADVPLDAASAKQMLQKRGVGKTVKVKEADGTELRAKIVSIGETSVVMQDGSKPTVEVPYGKVTAVKGGGLSKGAKIGIWVAVGVFVALGVLGTRV